MGNDTHANAFDHIGAAKPYGWCQANGVAHAYEAGASLLSEPPVQTRVCANCGWRQFKRPSIWTDQ